MASNIVKCSNCNVVINELLAFVRNVMDYMDEESLHQLCVSSFPDEEIVKAKTLLFDSVPNSKKMPLRRKQGKKKMSRDLNDIVTFMKSANRELFPIFVARDLHLLPPVTFDHIDVTRFTKEILLLKTQVKLLEEKMVTVDQIIRLQQEVDNMRHASLLNDDHTQTPKSSNDFKRTSSVNINNRKGACLQNSFELDSGPSGLQYVPEYVSINLHQSSAVSEVNERPSILRQSVTKESGAMTNSAEHVEAPTTVSAVSSECSCDAECECSVVNAGVSETALQAEPASRRVEAAECTAVSTLLEVATGDISGNLVHSRVSSEAACQLPESQRVPNTHSTATRFDVRGGLLAPDLHERYDQVVRDSEWQVVRNKSAKRYKLIGQRGCAPTEINSKFKAADIKVPLLISNVSKEVTENDIILYIKDKTGETVSLKMINMRRTKMYNSYKLYVSKHKLELFLSDSFWPSGITFRRFVHFLYKTQHEKLVKAS